MEKKKKNQKLRKLIKAVNLPEKLLNVMLGKDHPVFVRLLLGAVIMLVGTKLSHVDNTFCETCGGLIHATGAVPFLDLFILIGSIEKEEEEIKEEEK